MLQAQITVLSNENQLLRLQLRDAKRGNFAIFHCITEEEGEKVYLGRPRWARCGESFVLKARFPVQYPEAYGLYKCLHFVVYKTYSANVRAQPSKPLGRNIGSRMPEPHPDSEIIKLVSQDLMRAMEKVANTDEATQGMIPGLVCDKELRAPHLWWYHYRNRVNMLDGLTPSQADAMQSLLQWLDEVYGTSHNRVDDQFKRGVVSASSMGYLIHPGDVLVYRSEDSFEACLATSWLQQDATGVSTERPSEVPPRPFHKESERRWKVEAWSYRYTGEFYQTIKRLSIQLDAKSTHDAEISITDLDVFPLRFASQEVRDLLERRGKTFWDCRNGKYVSCSTKDTNYAPEQRYMIDCRTYDNISQTYGLSGNVAHNEEVLKVMRVTPAFIDQEDAPSEPDLYLFPRTVMGYDLERKRWEDVDVDRIRDIAWNKNAFSHRGTEFETRELTQAIIASHIASQTATGMPQSKDNGLVMLLQGATGTGKTFTVERAAEVFERPLYIMSCSDICKLRYLEDSLKEVFSLAKAWGCIVLLAEAEALLEWRTFNDTAQEARVSAFSHALKGYDGILILESNHLGELDEALKPLIQLVLHYEPLTQPQRAHVWRDLFSNLKLLCGNEIDFDNIAGYVDELAKREMNGHQMQSVITRARQLAQFQKSKMSAGHLQSVVKLIHFP
ncbi:P-loop containing nucleoside triphosphate hydrolase protein [Trichoderma citrinoviride]|uniref:P-loop containing nucleoside triphosphate hydrolase protein n=1 Tax=Trichoderma citrinoviride TaxID=58853 RepID=A0A2T4AYZ5_9HYPO|nr:P-loop containing nucleoside triphosphate hydrolase protein [Trichoderma citrinoviride]PTB62296.1 P-loop containing nucleoside triphosphate hydrolase protein [Trichoderma citrinoviride]